MKDLISAIKNANNIAIFPHISIDGDALGCCMALHLALKNMGKTAQVVVSEKIPEQYYFLPNLNSVKLLPIDNTLSFDLGIALDSSDTSRLGRCIDVFKKCTVTLSIDHHETSDNFATYNYADATASATGEIVFDLLNSMNAPITPDIATCLYFSIVADTNGFRYSNVTPTTHRIAANLLDKEASAFYVVEKFFNTFSYKKMKLVSLVINSLELHHNDKIAIAFITKKMLKKVGMSTDPSEQDTDRIIPEIAKMKDIEIFLLFREMDNNNIKVSLRSKTEFDVSAIARMYCGGGHKKAAGFTTVGKTRKVATELLKCITTHLTT